MKDFKCCGNGCDMHDENMRKAKKYQKRREVVAFSIGLLMVIGAIYLTSLIK